MHAQRTILGGWCPDLATPTDTAYFSDLYWLVLMKLIPWMQDGAQQLVNAQRTILGGRRPDLATAAEDASAAADILKKLAPSLRARPSLLGPLWGVAGAAAGAAAGLAPRNIADAIRGGHWCSCRRRSAVGALRRIADCIECH